MIWLLIFGGLFVWSLISDDKDVGLIAGAIGLFGFVFTWAGMGLL